MSDYGTTGSRPADEAYHEGRRAGLAMGAVAVSLVAFVSLLGVEKAVLGGVLAVLAMRRAAPNSTGRKLALRAVVIASVYVVAFIIILAVFHDKLWALLRQIQQLG